MGWLNGKFEDGPEVGVEHVELISHLSDYEEHIKQSVKDVIRLMDEFVFFSAQKKITNQEI